MARQVTVLSFSSWRSELGPSLNDLEEASNGHSVVPHTPSSQIKWSPSTTEREEKNQILSKEGTLKPWVFARWTLQGTWALAVTSLLQRPWQGPARLQFCETAVCLILKAFSAASRTQSWHMGTHLICILQIRNWGRKVTWLASAPTLCPIWFSDHRSSLVF